MHHINHRPKHIQWMTHLQEPRLALSVHLDKLQYWTTTALQTRFPHQIDAIDVPHLYISTDLFGFYFGQIHRACVRTFGKLQDSTASQHLWLIYSNAFLADSRIPPADWGGGPCSRTQHPPAQWWWQGQGYWSRCEGSGCPHCSHPWSCARCDPCHQWCEGARDGRWKPPP